MQFYGNKTYSEKKYMLLGALQNRGLELKTILLKSYHNF
jgi:hypothetical protein